MGFLCLFAAIPSAPTETVPRMITAVNVPDATSLSTIRQEQAGKFATCFLVCSCNLQNR